MWQYGDAYERYVGRWSRPVAAEFVRWLNVPAGRTWLDVGCGTGALTEVVLATAAPASAVGVDPAERFLEIARDRVPGARFVVGDAESLLGDDAGALPDDSDAGALPGRFDVVVSGLVLSFVPDAARAVRAWSQVGDLVAAYVWDYASGMRMIRHFWDVATELDPAAAALDEGLREPRVCTPEALHSLWRGLSDVQVREIVVPTVFADFDDFWTPFLGRVGPAPAYLATLSDEHVAAVRERLRERLGDGPIELTARAWAVRGR